MKKLHIAYLALDFDYFAILLQSSYIYVYSVF